MQLGKVIGHATATIKHPSMNGWRLLVVQPLNDARQPESDPVIAVSGLNPGMGQTVVLNSDGKGARDLVKHDHPPVRYFICAIESEAT